MVVLLLIMLLLETSDQTNNKTNTMKNNRYTLGIAGALALATVAAAAQDSDPVFRANETQLDIFGTVSVGQETLDNISSNRVEDNGRLGLGLGVNHFFTRYLGLGADAYTENENHSFVDNASANLILRFPIDKLHLAPYIYGGGGYQFDPTELKFAQAGAGLELRFTKQFGIFVDARYVFTDEVQDLGVGRAGIRIAF